jgi:single-strand DNA-binding protein
MFSQTLVLGNIGQDPTTRTFGEGDKARNVCNFNVAVNRSWTGPNGDKKTKTTWYEVSAWGKLGEIAQKYLTAKRAVMVIGEIEAGAYNKDGNPIGTLKLRADQIVFVNGGNGNGNGHVETEELPSETTQEEMPF